MVQVKTFYAFNELRNFSYLVYDAKTGEAWAIDPWEARPFIEYIKTNALTLKGILNTHQHFDHVRGNASLSETFACGVKKLSGPEKLVFNGETALEAIDTPGHTMDHQVFLIQGRQGPPSLFSGDTLFNAGVGNCKNGGNVDLLYETTTKLLKSLPPETRLFPGHDYIQRNLEFAQGLEPNNPAIKERLLKVKDRPVEERGQGTLKEELEFNPFLRLGSHELRENLLPKLNSLEDGQQIERHLFNKIRALRDKW